MIQNNNATGEDFLSTFVPGTFAGELDTALAEQLRQSPLDALNREIPTSKVVRVAQELSIRRFGRSVPTDGEFPGWRVLMYAPLYVSSYCVNHCLYCGFRAPGHIERTKLTVEEALAECQVLFDHHYRNILLVAGESNHHVPMSYLAEIIRGIVAKQGVPSIEIAPQDVAGYAELVEAGCNGITLFQETYDKELYPIYHPRGPKSDYQWRYESQRRAAEAGMKRLGFGFLCGLADPKAELTAMIRQARELSADYPDRSLSFGLPRIREAPNNFSIKYQVDDDLFIRMYSALRCAFPEAEMVTSTREQPFYRDQLVGTCISWVSAGSSTRPGGYRTNGPSILDGVMNDDSHAPQFPITDCRSVAAVSAAIAAMHHQVAW